MPINFVTGLPRQGKTLFTFIQVRERAQKENRPVFYCNIPEVTIEGWTEIDHPDKWMDCPNDSIIIVDELQDFWGAGSNASKVPLPILELSKHGKRGIDFYFITQDPSLVHNTPRKLCETHWHVVRAFGSENAMAHKFRGMQTNPDSVKSKAEKYPWRYPKEAFGKKDKAGNWITPPWYKSADVHNIKRNIPLKLYAIPLGLVIAGVAIWGAFTFFSSAVSKAKPGAGAVASAPVDASGRPVAAAPSSGGVRAAPVMTTAQYIESRTPRLPDFPHTAPAYDAVTQPTEAPYPAACIESKTDCKCFTQQATLMVVSDAMCKTIVHRGFFMDWKKEDKREFAQQQAQQAPQQSFQRSGQGYPVPSPQSAPIQPLAGGFQQSPQSQQQPQLGLRGGQASGYHVEVATASAPDLSPPETAAARHDGEMLARIGRRPNPDYQSLADVAANFR